MSNNQVSTFSLTPSSLQEAMQMADIMAGSQMVPKQYQGNPGNVLVAVQMGADLGLKPMAALQNIAVVNGNPCLWGDGLRAVVLGAPDLVDLTESFDDASMTAHCKIIREVGKNKKQVTIEQSFSKYDAEVAGLWGRNTWKSYPKRMLQWRAFGLAARDAYADRLKGIKLAEEVQDYKDNVSEREINPKQSNSVDPKQVHQSLTKSPDVSNAEPEQPNETDIPFGSDSKEFEPSPQAHDFGNAIYDCNSKQALDSVGKEIAQAVSNGTITGEEADWLRPMIKEVKAKL